MLVYRPERKQSCPRLKSIAIQAETEITGKSDKESIFPMMIAPFQPVGNLLRLLFQTFGLERCQPGMNC